MKPAGERIASLEQHMVDQDHKLDQIVDDIKEVKMIITNQLGFESRIAKLEKSGDLWKWLSPVVSAILSGVMTFLALQYLGSLSNR